MPDQAHKPSSHNLVMPAIVIALILVAAGIPATQAQTFTVFHAFSGKDGSSPNGDLIRDSAGNFYGTTRVGEGAAVFGVVFKLDPSGNETVLYEFTGGADGGVPFGRLFRDQEGTLYGQTSLGGDPVCSCGTVFKLTTDGVLTVLHAFLGGTDGMQNSGQPELGLLRIGNELYGATAFGGTPGCDGDLGCGVIFKVNQTGDETVLHRFSGGSDGASPRDLIRDSAGNLYGVTGGSYSTVSANGAVFKLDTAGQLEVLYYFPGGAEGSGPSWRLVVGTNGLLSGTTLGGGSSACPLGPCGIVFSLDTATGTERVLHTFGVQLGDGEVPSGALLNIAGNLFGVTYYGGIANRVCPIGCGVVYGISTTGTYKILHSFTGETDGWAPDGALIQGPEQALYGAAALGGAGGNGVIFKITP
jgi:uncharacterized repeat protein (TIGR03803 family)